MNEIKTDISTVHLIIKCACIVAALSLASTVGLTLHGDKDVALVVAGPALTVGGGLLALLAQTKTTQPPPAQSAAVLDTSPRSSTGAIDSAPPITPVVEGAEAGG